MKTDIHEYCEEMEVQILRLRPEDGECYKSRPSLQIYQAYVDQRWVVKAFNEGGYNFTEVDLVDLLEFVKREMPELWEGMGG